MVNISKEIVTLIAGNGLLVVGLLSQIDIGTTRLWPGLPFGTVFMMIGSSVASFSYGLAFLRWRGRTKASVSRYREFVSPSPSVSASNTTPMVSEHRRPEVTQPPTEPTPAAMTSTPANAPTLSMKSPPSDKLARQRLPQLRMPVSLRGPIIENRFPISMIAAGLGLVMAALAVLFPGAPIALFAGLFIPGILLLGLGSVILFLRFYREPTGLIRFCMHCGFKMSTLEVACGRCGKQPPSGVDTRSCPNCSSVIPALAKFCRECGAGQPTST